MEVVFFHMYPTGIAMFVLLLFTSASSLCIALSLRRQCTSSFCLVIASLMDMNCQCMLPTNSKKELGMWPLVSLFVNLQIKSTWKLPSFIFELDSSTSTAIAMFVVIFELCVYIPSVIQDDTACCFTYQVWHDCSYYFWQSFTWDRLFHTCTQNRLEIMVAAFRSDLTGVWTSRLWNFSTILTLVAPQWVINLSFFSISWLYMVLDFSWSWCPKSISFATTLIGLMLLTDGVWAGWVSVVLAGMAFWQAELNINPVYS